MRPSEARPESAKDRGLFSGLRTCGQRGDFVGDMPAADKCGRKDEPASDVVDSQPDERVPRGVIGAAEGGFQGIHVVGGETVDLVVQSPKALEPSPLPGAAPDGLEVGRRRRGLHRRRPGTDT